MSRTLKADSEIPHATPRSAPYSICRNTTCSYVWYNMLSSGERITRAGIRYSNMEPDQEINAEPRPTGVSARPNRNQCDEGTSPLAMGMKLVGWASEPSKPEQPA